MDTSPPVAETVAAAEPAAVPMTQDILDNQSETQQQQQQQHLVDSSYTTGDLTYQNDHLATTTTTVATKSARERWHWAYNRVVQVTATTAIAILLQLGFNLQPVPLLIFSPLSPSLVS